MGRSVRHEYVRNPKYSVLSLLLKRKTLGTMNGPIEPGEGYSSLDPSSSGTSSVKQKTLVRT